MAAIDLDEECLEAADCTRTGELDICSGITLRPHFLCTFSACCAAPYGSVDRRAHQRASGAKKLDKAPPAP